MGLYIKSLSGQEQGIGHVLLVVLLVVVIGVIGVAGYEVSAKNKPKASTKATTTTAGTEKVAASSSCVATYHDQNLCKFAGNANIDKLSYKATGTVANSQGTSTYTIESDGKDNTSFTATGSGQTIASVLLDGNDYIQTTSGGVWYEYPKSTSGDSSSSADSSSPTDNINLVLGAGITYKPEGTEACGSLTCYKYAVTDSNTPASTQTVWFDTKQYMLREWKSSDTASDGTAETSDLQFSYPGNIAISKPSPVQVFGQ